MDYLSFSEQQLINLLSTQEDRLSFEVVNEFVKRKSSMVKPLSDIVSDDFAWMRDVPEWWAVVHSVFILGAIGAEETIVPLLKSLRLACAHDCDWVTEQFPSIFARVGIKAISGLKMIALDWTTDWFTRIIAIEALAAITITNSEAEKDIFAFIGAIFSNEAEDKDVRAHSGNILLDFQKEEFKAVLLDFGSNERELKDKNAFYNLVFDDADVKRAFNSSKKDIDRYQRDWLSFYDENEIRQRQERWKEEDSCEDYNEDESSLYPEDIPFTRDGLKIGRNDPCPCGSGKKYKKCCGK
ncbi:MAG: SEC-C metal-binding domain-containing protein [Candidatus Omnitrophota bacterium]